MKKFPEGFTWGTATSSYQIEGGHTSGGKGPGIWDVFSHIPGKVKNGDHGDVACDHFHRFRDDVKLMAEMGVGAYRFSIAWPRVLPSGYGQENKEGIRFYSDLIDELLENNIEPWITMYHWDLPAALTLEHNGWLDPAMPEFFANYADLCFKHFGDRVKNWITLNEPWVTAIMGYGQGDFAPGRKSDAEPYLVAHHQLLAHARAVHVYREKYGSIQKGRIGITNNCDWREPLTDTPEDVEAAERALQFYLGWFADPVWKGDYPQVMKDRVGERLPRFSEEEKVLLKGSSDFFGLNHYTTYMASNVAAGQKVENARYGNGGIFEDQYVKLTEPPECRKTDMGWPVVPWGFRKLLNWINDRYLPGEIVITENGCAWDDQVTEGNVEDPARIEFFKGYLGACQQAIQDGVNVTGYFAWSLMDNFEWAEGYSKRFGLVHVDFESLQRTPKLSAHWYSDVIRSNGL